jgi:class 3 adenylate cyclase
MKKGKLTTQLPSGLVTFVFTDIVGSTELKDKLPAASSSERADLFHRLIKTPHNQIITECVETNGGVIVKGTGDGFLIAFTDAEKAVLSTLEIQDKLRAASIRTPLGMLQVRIGMNSGHAEVRDGDYTSSAVDKAARVESKGTPGQVVLSNETYGLVQGKIRDVTFVSAGFYEMKGIGNEELHLALWNHAPKVQQSAHLAQPNPREDIILIGDPDESRFAWFKELFGRTYQINTLQAATFEEVGKIAREFANDFNFRIVLLADVLPFSSKMYIAIPQLNFRRLEEIKGLKVADVGCLVTKGEDPILRGVSRAVTFIHFEQSQLRSPSYAQIIRELGDLRVPRPLVEPAPIPIVKAEIIAVRQVITWDRRDRKLRRQIRSLNENRDLKLGEECLSRLIRDAVGIDRVEKVEINR